MEDKRVRITLPTGLAGRRVSPAAPPSPFPPGEGKTEEENEEEKKNRAARLNGIQNLVERCGGRKRGRASLADKLRRTKQSKNYRVAPADLGEVFRKADNADIRVMTNAAAETVDRVESGLVWLAGQAQAAQERIRGQVVEQKRVSHTVEQAAVASHATKRSARARKDQERQQAARLAIKRATDVRLVHQALGDEVPLPREKAGERGAPLTNTLEKLPIDTMAQYNALNGEGAGPGAWMQATVDAYNHAKKTVRISGPPPPVIMAVLDDWKREHQKALAGAREVSRLLERSAPPPIFVSREHIDNMLREPHLSLGERHCCNIALGQCAAQRMWPEIKLREFLTLEELIQWNEARSQDPQTAARVLPGSPQQCWICVLRFCSHNYYTRLSAREMYSGGSLDMGVPDYAKDAGTRVNTPEFSSVITRFVVPVGVPGAYDKAACLGGDDEYVGLLGWIPLLRKADYAFRPANPETGAVARLSAIARDLARCIFLEDPEDTEAALEKAGFLSGTVGSFTALWGADGTLEPEKKDGGEEEEQIDGEVKREEGDEEEEEELDLEAEMLVALDHAMQAELHDAIRGDAYLDLLERADNSASDDEDSEDGNNNDHTRSEPTVASSFRAWSARTNSRSGPLTRWVKHKGRWSTSYYFPKPGTRIAVDKVQDPEEAPGHWAHRRDADEGWVWEYTWPAGDLSHSNMRGNGVPRGCRWIPGARIHELKTLALPAAENRKLMVAWARAVIGPVLISRSKRGDTRDERMFLRAKLRAWADAQQALLPGGGGEYCPLGLSYYPDDVRHATQTFEYLRVRRLPAEVLADEGEPVTLHDAMQRDIEGPPEGLWMPYQRVSGEHTIYRGVIRALDACERIKRRSPGGEKSDAAYQQQLAYVRLLAYCEESGRYDDAFLREPSPELYHCSPLEAFYPWSGSAIDDGDLPDLVGVMSYISLGGDKKEYGSEFELGRLLNKCLPHCCQSRMLVDLFAKACAQSPDAFAPVFSRMVWCCLAGTYPGTRSRPDGPTAVQQWRRCQDPQGLLDSLRHKEHESCSVIYTAFCRYLVRLGEVNPHFADAVNEAIGWQEFSERNRAMAEIASGARYVKRKRTNARGDDWFADCRIKHKVWRKQNRQTVHRYRKNSLIGNIADTLEVKLQKLLYEEREHCFRDVERVRRLMHALDTPGQSYWPELLALESSSDIYERYLDLISFRDREAYKKACREMLDELELRLEGISVPIDPEVKTRILRMAMEVPPHERMSPYVCYALSLPEYGGARPVVAHVIEDLTRVYRHSLQPKVVDVSIDQLDSYELKLLTWLFHCLRLADRVKLVPLPLHMTRATDRAMKARRHTIAPGGLQRIGSASCYSVCITLCCERIRTYLGRPRGHQAVRYDVNLECIVCDSKRVSSAIPPAFRTPADNSKEVEYRARVYKAAFLNIPCTRQPVHTICVRGYQMIYGTGRNDIKRYMHCPRCAAFHQVDPAGWRGTEYMCTECLRETRLLQPHYRCAYCDVHLPVRWVTNPDEGGRWIPPRHVRVWNLDAGGDPALGFYEDIYFCNAHYRHALYLSGEGLSVKRPDWEIVRRPRGEIWEEIGTRDVNRKIALDRMQ